MIRKIVDRFPGAFALSQQDSQGEFLWVYSLSGARLQRYYQVGAVCDAQRRAAGRLAIHMFGLLQLDRRSGCAWCLLDTGVVCQATLDNGIVKRQRTCFLHTCVVSSYARCVASCVTYDMSMTHPTIHVRGSQRGKKKCTDDYTRGRPADLNHNSKGSTFDCFVSRKCFWTSSDPRTGWKNFMESIGRMSSYGLLNFSDML